MSELVIRQLYEAELRAWAGTAYPIQFENQAFDPPAPDQTYLRATLLPAGLSTDLSGEGEVFTGVYAVDIFAPSGAGAGPALALAEELRRDAFPVYALLSEGDLVVQQSTPLQVGPAQTDATRHMVPTSFRYLATRG